MKKPASLDHEFGAKLALKNQAIQIARALANHPGATVVSSQTVELQFLRRTPDHVLQVRHPDLGERLYLFEVQSRVDPQVPHRLAIASLVLHQQTGLSVAPVLLYTGRVGKKRPVPVRYDVDGLLCHVLFREIVLADRDAREELVKGPDSPWWPFIPFMKGGRNRAVLEPMIRLMAEREDQIENFDHVIGMVGDVQIQDWVQRVLEGTMWDEVTGRHLRKGTWHYFLKEKWRTEEALRMVKSAIARIFGLPGEALDRRLEALSLEHLEALVAELAFLGTREELEAWIERTSI